jgi:hypothetical protein
LLIETWLPMLVFVFLLSTPLFAHDINGVCENEGSKINVARSGLKK